MNKYEYIIIGFGKGGKTLANYLGKLGKKVAIIEKSDKMYGGTCINVGCIPTKTLVNKSKVSLYKGLNTFEEKAREYRKSIEEKNALIEALRDKNYNMLNNNENVDVFNGTASFISNTEILINSEKEDIILEGEKIFINTGATTIIPNIQGIKSSSKIYNSTTIMELKELPKHLVIVGGGYIGLEFASIYASFGSKVTVIEDFDRIAGREDEDISKSIKEILEKKGIEFLLGSKVKSFEEIHGEVEVSYENSLGELNKIKGDAVLIAIGRKPNTEELNLEAAGVKVTERGAVAVDNKLKTNVPNIWAIGDVNGGPQFTYISLDDFRIIKDNLFGEGKRSTDDRKFIPYSVFIEPNLSRVGLSEKEALEKGFEIKTAKLEVNTIPRAKVIGETEGIMKAIVDVKTNKILGCTLLCAESAEIINIVTLAMKADEDYTFLRDNIFTHPTMSEALNDLFSLI
ncbi:FAD-dependent oxidoreductase [Clostridium perfringens]|uniref:Pyridine nucleotide-disulfide oxidoreductase n=1 Tax=Clostridium perfringens TaxID=1502 RepID=A0AAE8K764_CLOPF|nr:FAD-dependent oxidoreductase [Clostridium perfringens]MDH5071664.1 Mercuric reductase [Clostridium perfringens]MDK0543788.1 FAD-dependent oxidoreductase [Clostridium perfringens]MDK0608100.1 FAD-dependent oxidoreductase [Clostridium perfringens]MDK0623756.1 FAD-dependent oxidoreductase [Clostridium perfringens]MDK0634323.1 FAD-dependent oxidoreductase [Clostridium perfringens]